MVENKNMKLYSHSRLWLFENCPEAFKVKYIDKKFPDLPKSIEAFLGSMVHESLEWLYKQVMEGSEVDLDELIHHYANNWTDNFSSEYRVRNGSAQRYFDKGVKFLIDYYQNHKPFSENTIEIEKRIVFPLDEEEKFGIQGYIDRIVHNKETDEYEVHDYKTNEYMKKQEQVDKDRQLALYHLGLQRLFGKQIKVKLLWHFLAHNKTITSRRTQAELDKLKEETLELIKKIESNTAWPSCGKQWCDWCNYKAKNGLNNW